MIRTTRKALILCMALSPILCAADDTNSAQFSTSISNLAKLISGEAEGKYNAQKNEQPEEQNQSSKPTDKPITQNDSSENLDVSVKDLINGAKVLKATPSEMQDYIAERLSTMENPEFVLKSLVKSGELALSPGEIRFILSAIDLKTQALNAPLMTPDVRSGVVSFDSNDRYKMYKFSVHKTGITMLEFYDANGKKWPVVDFTDTNGFSINYGYHNNTLVIESNVDYKIGYSYIQLEGYKNQIAIELVYENKVRDGIRTFRIPFIYKLDENSNKANATYTPLTSIKAGAQADNESKIPDVEYQDLMFIAESGYPDQDSKSSEYIEKVYIDKPEIAQIWRYGDKFIVRSRFQLMSHQYNAFIPANDDMAVYVADELDTVISFNVNGESESVFIPDYHLFE